jgi:MoxR-like ATPase
VELTEVREIGGRVLDEVGRAVVGKRTELEVVLLGILADGHVLLEDVPGLAKTLAARSFAQAMGLEFSRVQFTPDLLPSDVTGSSIWNQRDADFEFRPGPSSSLTRSIALRRKHRRRCSRRCRNGR